MENISGLFTEIVVAVVAAFAANALAFFGFWRKAKAELEQSYLLKFNEKKWAVYTDFTQSLQKLLSDTLYDLGNDDQNATEAALASQIVLIGSDEVVRAFREWRQAVAIHGKSQQATRMKLFTLVAKMRNDLGIKYSTLEVEDLLGALNPDLASS